MVEEEGANVEYLVKEYANRPDTPVEDTEIVTVEVSKVVTTPSIIVDIIPNIDGYVANENIVVYAGNEIDVNKLFKDKVSGDDGNTLKIVEPFVDTNTPGQKEVLVEITGPNGGSKLVRVPITVKTEIPVTVTVERTVNGKKVTSNLPTKEMTIGERLAVDEILEIDGKRYKVKNYNNRETVINNLGKEYKLELAEIVNAGIIEPVDTESTKKPNILPEKVVLGGKLNLLDNLEGLLQGAIVTDVTEPKIDTKVAGRYVGRLKIQYPNGIIRYVEVPVEVTDKITVMVVVKAENGRIVKQVEKEVTIGRKLVSEELVDILPEGYMIGNVEDKLVTSENDQKLSVNIVKISKGDIKGKVDFPYNFPEDIELLVELYKDGQKTGKFVKVSSRNPYYEFKNLDETDKYGRKITYTIGIENLKNLEEAGYEAKISETGEIYVLKITNKKIAGKAENDDKLKGKGEKENQSNQRLPYAGINGSDIVKLTVGGLVFVGIGYLVKVYVRR